MSDSVLMTAVLGPVAQVTPRGERGAVRRGRCERCGGEFCSQSPARECGVRKSEPLPKKKKYSNQAIKP